MIFRTNLPLEFKNILSASRSEGQKPKEYSPFKMFASEIDNEIDDAKVVLKKRFSDLINRGENKLLSGLKEKFGSSLIEDEEPEPSPI